MHPASELIAPVFCLELQRGGVHTIAKPRGRRAVLEDMTEMGPTVAAGHFRALHAAARVGRGLDGPLRQGLEEAGQPLPESNLVVELNSGSPQQMQR